MEKERKELLLLKKKDGTTLRCTPGKRKSKPKKKHGETDKRGKRMIDKVSKLQKSEKGGEGNSTARRNKKKKKTGINMRNPRRYRWNLKGEKWGTRQQLEPVKKRSCGSERVRIGGE